MDVHGRSATFAHAIGIVVACALAVALAGCTAGSSELVNMWRAPEAPAAPLHSVLVVSMAHEPAMRRIWEDRFVAELAKHGTHARPSYQLFPNQAPDTTDLAAAVTEQGYDGVVSIHRLANESTAHYVPGYSTVEPYQRYSPWTGYYHTHYVEAYHPGFVETDTIVRYEVDVWSPEPDRGLLWSGITETINPGSSADVNRQISHLIVPELGRSGVVTETRRG
jgi:hypothetical protein